MSRFSWGNKQVNEGGSASDRSRRMLTFGRGVTLAVVVLAPEAAAWQGLLELARHTFHLGGGWEYLVPLLFGAAAFYVALLALRYVLAGDSAVTERFLTWAYAAAGAGFNYWYESSQQGNVPAALFFGGASMSAALLWDRTLRAWRRDELRAMEALERPLPRFRLLRWLLAPGQTFQAFRIAVLQGLTTPAEALAAISADAIRLDSLRAELPAAPTVIVEDVAQADGNQEQQAELNAPVAPAALPALDLANLSKAQVVLEGLRRAGADLDGAVADDRVLAQVRRMLPNVVAWAADNGVKVTESYAYDALRRHVARAQLATPAEGTDTVLRVVGGA